MKKFSTIALAFALSATFTVACSKKDDAAEGVSDSRQNTSESSMAAANSVANDTEGGSLGFTSAAPEATSPGALAACDLTSARSSCVGAASSVTFSSCTIFAGLITLNGGWTNTYDSGATCTSALGSSGLLPNGGSVTRTSSSFTVTYPSQATMTSDTVAHSAYSGAAIGSGVATSRAGTTRTVTIAGMHRILRGPKGTKWFDHSITSSGMTMVGSKALGTRTVSGTMALYHNLAQYTATSTFNSVQWGTPSCCYPTAGTITTSFSGTVTGNSTLAFGTPCGSAQFTDAGSSTASTITLSQCE